MLMPTTPEEQLKCELAVEQVVATTPEVLSFPHDILGKEYKFDGVSFTVLGMQPVYYSDEEKEELPHGIVAILNVQKQRIPVIPFKGGYASITKIRIDDEVIVGYADIIKNIMTLEHAPEGWMTNGGLADEMKAGNERVTRIAGSYRQSHSEWFHKYRTVMGNVCEHYTPELCSLIRNEITKKVQAPERWMNNASLMKELDVADSTIARQVDIFRVLHPEWISFYSSKAGGECEYYSPELCVLIKEALSQVKKAPEGWMTEHGLAVELKTTQDRIKSIVDSYRISHPDYFQKYKCKTKAVREHLSPELCTIIRKNVGEISSAPEGWRTRSGLSVELHKSKGLIHSLADKYKTTHPQWFHKYKDSGGQLREFYSQELCTIIQSVIKKIEQAPQGWMTNGKLAHEQNVGESTIRSRAEIFRKSHPELFCEYWATSGHFHEHYAPELCDLIRKALKNKRS